MTMTTIDMTLAPACFDAVRVDTSAWVAPVQGIAMSAPAYRLGHVAGMTASVAANAAKGADRKRTTGNRTTGNEAFEDPV